jgi:hypothetical protein
MESVSGMEWNQCPLSRGIGVRIALEYSQYYILMGALPHQNDPFLFLRMYTPGLSCRRSTEDANVFCLCQISTGTPAYGTYVLCARRNLGCNVYVLVA